MMKEVKGLIQIKNIIVVTSVPLKLGRIKN